MLKEIKLNLINCTFEEREITIIDKMKNGEPTGEKDENGKVIIERIPATVWKTSDGNFDSRNLDCVKVDKDYLYVKTENTTEFAHKLLVEYAITHLKSIISTATQRKEVLRQNIQEQETKLEMANKCLKTIKEILI